MTYLDKLENRQEFDSVATKNIKTGGFTHLHVHTEYSLLDGMSKIEDLIQEAKKLGMTSLAITDHGTMFGVVHFSQECKKHGIKPIIGCEVYTAERTLYDKESVKDRPIGHLILLCKNKTGYKNLIKIVSKAYTEGLYYKPRTDKNELKKHSKGLICLSGCLAGRTQRLIVQGKYDEAKKEALELKEIFGDDFYLEVQDHGQEEDKISINGLMKLSREIGVPLVATNDSHYTKKEDAKAHELLLCMQIKSTINNPNRMQFNAPEYYLKSEDEMRSLFSYIPEACDNTKIIADKCRFDFEYGHYNIPSYTAPKEYKSNEDYFEALCRKGLKKRYGKITKKLNERLDYEMSVIKEMGFVEYFLIVWDFINYAKSNDIAVGPGRGSAAGSLVAYCLAITEIDPFKYDLFFERFLNPERVSMPDIDVDFCIKRRAEVINYVKQKYGEENVCQISTLGTMQAKMAVKDVARVLGVPFAESNMLSKLIPEKMTLDEALNDPDLRKEYDRNPQSKTIIDFARRLEDIPRHSSTHAAGIVITPKAVDEYVPLIKSNKGIAAQYTMTEIEQLGLLKMDFLGLRNLTVIEDALKLIKQNHGINVDINKIEMDDPNVYDMISRGKTVGVFQLESKGITDFMRKLKPSRFEDIIAGVSLYRPGPMDSIPRYIENKRHPEKIKYLTPKLAPILDVTYGCIVYQEQVMQIVQSLAGYSFARADNVRRAMSKKKASVMAEERNYFINGKIDKEGNIEIPGCVRNGIDKSAAEKIFGEMESFAQYAFNKSHATAYSVITYQTAWLKYYYPSEFMAALMTSEQDKPEHLSLFIKEARKTNATNSTKKIKVFLPDINKSRVEFSTDNEGNIYYGLAAIKGVGQSLAEDIKSTSHKDIISIAKLEKMNSKALEALAYSGALNSLTSNSATAVANINSALDFARKIKKSGNQVSLFEEFPEIKPKIVYQEPFSKEEILGFEKEYLGIYISGHPLKAYKVEISKYTTIDPEKDSAGIFAGMINSLKLSYTKKGKKMAFATIEDLEDNVVETVIFPNIYARYASLIEEGKIVAGFGHIEEGTLLIDELTQIDELSTLYQKHSQKQIKELHIRAENYELPEIIKVLNKFHGTIPVRIYPKQGQTYLISNKVSCDQLLLLDLKELVGNENASFWT